MCDNRGIGVKHVPLLLTCELFIFSIYSRSYTRHNTLGAKNSDTFRYGVGEGGGRRHSSLLFVGAFPAVSNRILSHVISD